MLSDAVEFDSEKYQDFLEASRLAKIAFTGRGVKVCAEFNKPRQNMGSLAIIGRSISVSDYDAFRTICRLSDGAWEVYAFLGGYVQMNFSFYNQNNVLYTED